MSTNEKKVILIIADISGYTKFMLANKTCLIHGQIIINQIITNLIKQVEIPLEISKLEGDAIFLYVIKKDDENNWEDIKGKIREKLIILRYLIEKFKS